MPTVRYTGSGQYRVPGEAFDPGDERDVSEDLADHLRDVDEFDVLEDDGGDEPDAPDRCETVKSDGEVCGRELPCAYHSDDDGEE